ncbi:MAG: IS630 family transposase [Bacteroidales bacterium]
MRHGARKAEDSGYRIRCLMILKLGRGQRARHVAEALEVAPATVSRVAQRFREHGVSGLVDRREENGPRKVTDEVLGSLARLVATQPLDYGWRRPTWTRELLARELAHQTGVTLGIRTIARWLDALGARWGRGRPTVLCPWPRQKRARRLRALERIVEASCGHEPVFYLDEMDVHLNPRVGPDWMLPRTQKVVMTPGQNQKRFVAGALHAGSGKVTWVVAAHKRSGLFIALLHHLAARHGRARRIHLVLDNYSIHTSRQTRAALAEYGDRFVLHFLPPFSPDGNRIERLWKDVHANVTRHHRCRTIDALLAAVEEYLRRVGRVPADQLSLGRAA